MSSSGSGGGFPRPSPFEYPAAVGEYYSQSPYSNSAQNLDITLVGTLSNCVFAAPAYWSGPSGVQAITFGLWVNTEYTGSGSSVEVAVYIPINQSNPWTYQNGSAYATLLQDVGNIPLSLATVGFHSVAASPTVVVPPNTWFCVAGWANGSDHTGLITCGAIAAGSQSPLGADITGGSYTQQNATNLSVVRGGLASLPATLTPNLAHPTSRADCGIAWSRSA